MIHGLREPSMVEDRFLKRLRKKARKRLRGWPIATVAFYGPNLSQATKVAVGIVPSENAEVEEFSPGRSRLQRRMVSGLRVLART